MNLPAVPPRVFFPLKVKLSNIFEVGAKMDKVPKIKDIKMSATNHTLKERIQLCLLAKAYMNRMIHAKIIIEPKPKVESVASYIESDKLTARFLYW